MMNAYLAHYDSCVGPVPELTSFSYDLTVNGAPGNKTQFPSQASLEGDEVVIRDTKKKSSVGTFEDAIAHCPEQAYITVSEVCIFNCQYCPCHSWEVRVKNRAI